MKNVLLSPGSFTKLFFWSEIIYWWEMRCQFQGNPTLVPQICPVNCSQIWKHLLSSTLRNPERCGAGNRVHFTAGMWAGQPLTLLPSHLLHNKTIPLTVWGDEGMRNGDLEPDGTSSAGRWGNKTIKGDQKSKREHEQNRTRPIIWIFQGKCQSWPKEGSLKQLMFYCSMGVRVWLNQLQPILLSCGREGNADVFSGNDEVRRSFRVWPGCHERWNVRIPPRHGISLVSPLIRAEGWKGKKTY